MTDELPEIPESLKGWTIASVRSVVSTLQYGISTKADTDAKGGIVILRMGNIQNGRLDLSDLKYVPRSKDLDPVLLNRGDVLFNRTNSPDLVGKSAVVDVDDEMVFASYLIRLTARTDAIDPKYLCWWINSTWGRQWAARVKTDGVSQSNINGTKLGEMPIALAPLPEQHRIVEKVEALLEQVNRAKERLDRVPLILKRFRKALMLAACSGRLTADWREKHPSPQVGSVYDDIDKGGLPEIPDTWRWVRLTDLGELARGKSRHRPRNDPKLFGGRYPFIQTGDVARSRGRITNHSQTYNEAGLAQSRLWPKDTVCITIAANIAESGLLDYPACFPDSVVGLITDRNVCLPEYAEFFIKTARSSLAQFAPATAQANINLEILSKEVSVPLPPTAEQLEIVRTGVSLLHLADTIERRVQAATARANKLPQAILSKAFSGELVPTEAELARLEGRTYETAEELLKRVTALGSDAPSARKGLGTRAR